MADPNNPPPALSTNFANDPWFCWVHQQMLAQQQQIVALQLQNKDQQEKLDEIDSHLSLRELVTRVDHVIVKNLIPFVGPLDLSPPGTPIVLRTRPVSGLQLCTILDRHCPEREGMLPPGMSMGTLRAIGGVLGSLKMHADSFAHDRVFEDVKLGVLMDQVLPCVDACGTGQCGRLLIEWIRDNYSVYLKSGSEPLLEGEQIPFDRLKAQAERATE